MTTMMFSVVLGSIGVGYFMYGKKQQKLIPLVAGVALCVVPYLVRNPYATGAVGAILTAAPWLLKE